MEQSAQKDTTLAPASASQSPSASLAPVVGTEQVVQNPSAPRQTQSSGQGQKPTSQQSPANKLPLILVAIVAFLLLAVLLILGVVNQKKVTPQASSSPSPPISAAVIPEKNLTSANGEVLNVNPEEKKLSIRSLSPGSNGILIIWTVTVIGDTVLAKFDDWAKASSGESTLSAGQPKTDNEIKAQVKRMGIDDFEVGDSVYLMVKQGQDLATQTNIEGPEALLLQ